MNCLLKTFVKFGEVGTTRMMFWLQLLLQKFPAQLVQMLQEQSYEILPVLPII